MDIDENKEAKGKKDTHGKKEGENEKSVIEKEAEIVDDGVETKEGEVEDGGEKKNEGEVKENGDEKEGKEMEVVEEKEDTQQITNVGNMEEVKEDTENASATKAEDVKMVDAEDVKDEEKGEIGEQEEKAQNREEKDVNKEGDAGTTEEKVDEDKEAEGSEKKRSRAKKASLKGKRKDKKEGETKAKQFLGSPVLSIERPVRERKTVERLVEIIERQTSKEFQVEKGQGTPLKDIPNVAYKLARRKPADIKLIHQTLFGRKGKAVDFKSHILQFSGFVWHGSDEKKRAKMKEKLDKYVEDALLDLCDFFDLPVSRANTRKEDLVAKLLDFLVAPHPTTDAALADKDQKSRRRKRMARGIASKMRGILTKCPRKKRTKSVDMPTAKENSAQETEDAEEEDDDMENGLSEEKVHKHSEGEAKETESGEATDDDEDDDVDEEHEGQLGKGKQDKKKTIKQQGDVAKEKLKVGTSPKKSSLPKTTNSPGKRSAAKLSKAEEDNDISNKVFTGKKRNSDSSKKKSTLESSTKEKTTDKKMARGKTKPLEVEQPSKEDLRKKICEILKEVDFKATFIDVLKELATHYKMDLTPRKASLKLMIQEELTKLAEEDEEDGEDVNYDEKEEKLETKGKEVEA